MMGSQDTKNTRKRPPDFSPLSTHAPKKSRRESLSDVVAGAALVVTNALSGRSSPVPSQKLPSTRIGVSPGRAVELRGKNYEQLRSLQKLYKDSILTAEQLEEQKDQVLSSLKKLSH